MMPPENDNDAVVNEIVSNVTNYLKYKGIPYITMDGTNVTMKANANANPDDCDVDSDTNGIIKIETVHVNTPVKCIADLLRICETHELAENVRYNIDMNALHKIYPHLRELNNMIGMTAIKQTIVDQIMYFIQRLHLTCDAKPTTDNRPLPPVHITKKRKTFPPSAIPASATSASAQAAAPVEEAPLSALFSFFISDAASAAATTMKEKPREEPKKSASASSSSNNIFKFPANAIFAPSFLGPQPSLFSSKRDTSDTAANANAEAEAGDYMHTVLYGPPGTGKTEVAKILGNIFCNLGVLKSNTFKKVTRSDLVAGYLGQTAIKTREVIDAAIGGVLFIDEAYALGNTEKRDSFSKECIDTLCEALSDHKHELMVIIAGYEKELTDCFFSYNEGLSSRFTWRYKIENYDAVELRKIFEKIMKDHHWTFDSKETDATKDEWFKSRVHYFKYFGRDIEVFFTKTKIAHSRRVFYLSESARRKFTMQDLDAGFELFTAADDVKSRGQLLSGPAATMYL